MVLGRCNCGAVAFTVQCEVTDVYLCHCSICQTASGGAGVAVVIVAKELFNWEKGLDSLRHWRKPKHDWHCYFCQICGTPMPGDNDEQRMYIPVGSIVKGGENLKVAHHLFVDSKAPWDEIAGEGVQHSHAHGSGND